MEYAIKKVLVNNKTILKVNLAEGGGAAISLMPASAADLKTIKKYK
jgi:hypothetical protein